MQFPIHHSYPSVDKQEALALERVLNSGHHARGSETQAFEKELSSCIKLPYAHATSSGTTALILALAAFGIRANPLENANLESKQKRNKVLVPSLSCAALLNALYACGAEPLLYDCGYQGPKLEDLENLLDDTVRALIIVAPFDGACVPGILPEFQGVPVIYDRCQQLAPWSSIKELEGTPAALKLAQESRASFEIFSFYATKCISTGSGGALATTSRSLYEKAVDLNTPDKREDYAQLRYNFAFDDIRAAIGREQLKKLAFFVKKRKELAQNYDRAFQAVQSNDSKDKESSGMVFRYLYTCRSETECDNLQAKLKESGIETKRPVYRPLHRYLGYPDQAFPLACDAWMRGLSIPLYPELSEQAQNHVISTLLGILQ